MTAVVFVTMLGVLGVLIGAYLLDQASHPTTGDTTEEGSR